MLKCQRLKEEGAVPSHMGSGKFHPQEAVWLFFLFSLNSLMLSKLKK